MIVFLTFVRDNFPNRADLHWLRKGGGMFGGDEPPSHRFNAGEKLVFWGGVVRPRQRSSSAPAWCSTRSSPASRHLCGDMQVAHMIHGVATLLMMAMFLGHIYIGTIGMRGAYRAMKTGYVDEGWAREHHRLWYDDIKAGKIPECRSAPAGRRRPERLLAQA